MRICVTKKDIAKARLELVGGPLIYRSTCCPVAQSLKRGGFSNCTVGIETLWLDRASKEQYRIPHKAARWIHDFDMDLTVSPITFTIEKAKC